MRYYIVESGGTLWSHDGTAWQSIGSSIDIPQADFSVEGMSSIDAITDWSFFTESFDIICIETDPDKKFLLQSKHPAIEITADSYRPIEVNEFKVLTSAKTYRFDTKMPVLKKTAVPYMQELEQIKDYEFWVSRHPYVVSNILFNGNAGIKFVISPDKGETYYTVYDGAVEKIIPTKESVTERGIEIMDAKDIAPAHWHTIFGMFPRNARFYYVLDMESSTDLNKALDVKFTFTYSGEWEMTSEEQATYTYPRDYTVQIVLRDSGTYKVNGFFFENMKIGGE